MVQERGADQQLQQQQDLSSIALSGTIESCTGAGCANNSIIFIVPSYI